MANNRNTLWRQGSVLSQEATKKISSSSSKSEEDPYIVIVSHDCDLANGQETNLEVIIGKIIKESDGNFTHAKNARKLHIEFKQNGQPITIELLADKTKLLKQELTGYLPRNDLQD